MGFDMKFDVINFNADKLDNKLGNIIDSRAEKLKREIQADAPTRTGEYKSGWTVKKTQANDKHEATVLNKQKWQLTHLLANDHKNKWGGTTGAVSNFNSIASRNIKDFNKDLDKLEIEEFIETEKI